MEYEIYELAYKLLTGRSETRSVNALRVADIYEDQKIVVEGLHPLNLNENRMYDSIYIGLRFRSAGQPVATAFKLPGTSKEDETIVYLWRERVEFYRPGKWETYLKQIVESIELRFVEVGKLHRVRVDDDAFFPDVP